MQLKTNYGSKVEYVVHSKADKCSIYVKAFETVIPMLILDFENESQQLIKQRLEKDLAENAETVSI